MKKLKQILTLFTFTLLLISCSSNPSSNATTPTLQAKWAFGMDTGCGRNAIEFKNTNVFIEYHYDGSCVFVPYYGQYSRTGDIVTINGVENIIVELTSTTLKLHQINNNSTKTYDKIN